MIQVLIDALYGLKCFDKKEEYFYGKNSTGNRKP